MKSLRHALSLPFVALLAAPLAAQVGAGAGGGQDPTQGSLGGDPVGQLPVTPRDTPDYTGPGDTAPPPPAGDAPIGPTDPAGGDGTQPTIPPFDNPGSNPPGGAGGGLPGTPGLGPADPATTAAQLGLDLTTWTWWWELNKEPFLVGQPIGPPRPVTGGGSFLGGGTTDLVGAPPSDAVVFEQIVPSLLETVRTEHADGLLAASALSLARIGAGRSADRKSDYADALELLLVQGDQALVESTALALGILGSDSSATLLAELARGTRAGRETLGGRRVPMRVQTFAAYALGLLGSGSANEDVRRYVVSQLVWTIQGNKSESVDLDVACINALGLVPIEDQRAIPAAAPRRGEAPDPPGSSLAAQVDYLCGLLGERSRDRRVRAQVPIALGRLLARSAGPNREALRRHVAEELFDRLAAHRREPRELIQSCVIALGQIGDNDGDELDKRIRRTLVRVEDLTNDLPARQFALIALGRVLGRKGDGAAGSLRDERAYLMYEFGRGGTVMRPWGALALGIWENGGGQDDGTRRALRLALDDARVEREVGAYAISTGLARDGEAADVMLRKLEKRGDEPTRAYVALSLGLSASPSGESPLLTLLPTARFQPRLLREAALGLGLLGSPEVVPRLVELLSKTHSLASQTSISQALARSGDARAVEPLIALLGDTGATDAARSYAAAALGWIAEEATLPWTASYSVDANLHAAPETLFAPQGTGLLNLF